MNALTSPTLTTESPLPVLTLDLSLPETSTLPTPSDCCGSVLCPSIQSNLPKPRASLLIRDPSLPSLGMRTAIAWRQEQLRAARLRMDERNRARRAAGMIPVTQTMSQILDTAIDAMVPWNTATDTTPPIRSRYQHPSHPYLSNCYDKDLYDRFLFIRCTNTGVTATHALSFYRLRAPLFLLTHAQLAVVTQSCALLYIAAHCDLLLQ